MASAVTSEEDLPDHAMADDDVDGGQESPENEKSLVIPVTSSSKDVFIEIFPEEMSNIRPATLSNVLRDEGAPLKTWCEASLLYMKGKREKEGCELLTSAVDNDDVMGGSNNADRLRLLVSSGIAALAQANRHEPISTTDDDEMGSLLDSLLAASKAEEEQARVRREELQGIADARFVKADSINQVNPQTWIAKGMLNLAQKKFDQAKFFFDNLTMRQEGEILPALIGMAAVKYLEKDYKGAQELYAKAMEKFPVQSGAAVRVGFGVACYRLNEIDRAKAAFRRAHDMDPDNVEALMGLAILEMASLDSHALDANEYRAKAGSVIQMISQANLVDHTNASVQNHLANHYFWKWSPVPGMVSVESGSNVVTGSNVASSLEAGDRIRIGKELETLVVVDDEDEMAEGETFKIKDTWKFDSKSNLKIWKKDYERVISLAKSAYSSTNIPGIQAESLYMLARVFHARGEMTEARELYDKAVFLDPNLYPARYGLAQTLIWEGKFEDAATSLKLLLGTCTTATDALAAMGLLDAKAGKRADAFTSLRKAIDLDPFNADLVLIEALALQQHETDYPASLDRYRHAVRLLEAQGRSISADVLTNMGVLCHETKQYEEALEMYTKALDAIESENPESVGKPDETGDSTFVRHEENSLFWKYQEIGIRVKINDKDKKLLIAPSDLVEECADLLIKVGDGISLGEGIFSTVTDVTGDDDALQIKVKDDVELKSPETYVVSVKRSNGRIQNPSVVSIAFNLARLHETSGRIVPAVELHKAILKQHPSYVNSYLRLACIARDCGSLKDCSEWLKNAVAVAPGNPEVLTLVGNLHLSLCDWAPAQKVFDQLLQQKVPKVEAYSMLSLGNIYFNNLNTPKKYNKHLHHAADFYRRILQKDTANAYAANGLGTVLAEKGELLKAKEIFNRVREVSGDTLSDALLNLGHIYLAQKKHPEALQMYQNYMGRCRRSGAQTTSKSQEDDEAEVLLYIAFAYFDWARQTELFNNAKAAPADERYRMCIEYIEKAMEKSKRENVVLRYNWCLSKLQAANCVLRKVDRNIRRTAAEVSNALEGLKASLPIVQTMLQWKNEGRKVTISSDMLKQVINQIQHNIQSAESHLNEELKKEKEAETLRTIQRVQAEAEEKSKALQEIIQKERDAEEMEAREQKARQKMEKAKNLADGWKQRQEAEESRPKKKKGQKGDAPPGGVDDETGFLENDVDPTSQLFDDSDSDDSDQNEPAKAKESTAEPSSQTKNSQDLFGDSSDDDSDDDTNQAKKRSQGDEIEEPEAKKSKIAED